MRFPRVWIALVVVLMMSSLAFGQEPTDTEQRIKDLEKKVEELTKEKEAPKAQLMNSAEVERVMEPVGVAGFYDNGYLLLSSADGAYKYWLDGRVHLDAASYPGAENRLPAGFEVRRARIGLKATLARHWLAEVDLDFADNNIEMSTSISEVEKNASRSHDLAKQVCDASQSGIDAVRETTSGMEDIRRAVHEANDVVGRLGKRSDEIGQIVTVIEDIAAQTNLLALNAAILAAQAGEHGRGFTVVADEIRELAERTATSTKEIGVLVDSVQSEVEKVLQSIRNGSRSVDRGVTLAGDAKRVLGQILEAAQKSLGMSKDIAGAMKEQARSSESVTHAVERVQDMVRQINSATSQQATGSDHIRSAVERMREVAKSVQHATVEQRSGSQMISNAAEQMIEMIRQISGIAMSQASESEQIVHTMEQVRGIADGNRRSASEMNETVETLAGAIRELDEQVHRFKVRA